MLFDEVTRLKYGILSIIWIEFSWVFYLNLRQNSVCVNTTTVPDELKDVIHQDTFEKARLYSIDKLQLRMLQDICSVIDHTLVIFFGLAYSYWPLAARLSPYSGEIAQTCVWLLIQNTIGTIIELPQRIYFTFCIEEKYGFNKQTPMFFIIDTIKTYFVSQVANVLMTVAIITVIKNGGDYFFLWLWLMTDIFVLVFLIFYPPYIAPLFDNYKPLPDGELRRAIESLAKEVGFPLSQIYIVLGSKRSGHSNAYLTGLFHEKRIVLYDTLFESPDKGGCNQEEILAILAHELGHWNYGHIPRNLIILQINLFFMFYTFGKMLNYAPLYEVMGFPAGERPVIIGLISVMQFIMTPYAVIANMFLTYLSRIHEYEADAYAVKLGKGKPLSSALIKITKNNLGFPIFDPLFSKWHLTHPALLERLSAIKEEERRLS